MEVHAILQGDGTREKLLSGRDDHTTATLLRAEINRFLNRFLVLGSSIGHFCPVLGDYIHFIRKLRYADALFNLLVFCLIPALGSCSEGEKQTERHQLEKLLHIIYKMFSS